jgi:hypothetical protein
VALAGRRLRTSNYNTGMMNRFRMVEITIPPNTVVPTE